MKKFVCALLCAALIFSAFVGCSKNEQKPEIKIDQSKVFSKEEIEAAMNVVLKEKGKKDSGIRYFSKLAFDETRWNDRKNELKVTYQADEKNVIILFSSFKTKSDAALQGLNGNDVYDDFCWILTRNDKNSKWKIVDCGY